MQKILALALCLFCLGAIAPAAEKSLEERFAAATDDGLASKVLAKAEAVVMATFANRIKYGGVAFKEPNPAVLKCVLAAIDMKGGVDNLPTAWYGLPNARETKEPPMYDKAAAVLHYRLGKAYKGDKA